MKLTLQLLFVMARLSIVFLAPHLSMWSCHVVPSFAGASIFTQISNILRSDEKKDLYIINRADGPKADADFSNSYSGQNKTTTSA